MAVDKNFVVKNGLEVNSDLIVTDSSDSQNKKVGIGSTGPRTTLDVRGGIAATDGNFTGILTASSVDISSFGLVNGSGANITGFSTLGGVSADQLSVSGVGTFTDISYDEATGRNLNLTGIATIPVVVGLTSFTDGITIAGVLTATHISGGGFGVGIKTSGSVIGYGFTMLNFVGSGNTFAVNGTTVDISIAGGGGGSASIGVGSTPGDAFTGIITAGNLWYNTGLGRLFIYYQDDNSAQWVDAAPFNVGIITTLTNVSFDAGTVAAPAISFGSDTDSGFFSPTDGSVTVSSNGVGIVTFNSTGVLATTYFGDGSQLTGISVDSTSLKDDDGNIKVQANPNGAVVTGISTFNGNVEIKKSDGSENIARFLQDSAVKLYFNGVEKFTTGSLGIDVTGQTQTTNLKVTGVSTVGVVTGGTSVSASHFYGDGSALTGIDATSIKDSGGNVKAQANPGGIVITGVATATSFVGDLTGAATQVTVADESSDTSCNVLFTTAATGDQAPKTGTNLTFNSNSGQLTATSFSGDGSALTGIDSIKDSGGNVKAQANPNGVVVTGVLTATSFSGDGTNLTFAPKIIAFDPAALAVDVAVDKTITITFDQNIVFDGNGTVSLRSGSASGSVIQDFAISSGTPATGLSISGTQLIINPTSNLNDNTVVYVVLPSSGIENEAGVVYGGSNNYNFRTVAASFSASGGDVVFTQVAPTSPTGYHRFHIFTSSGILTTTSDVSNANDFAMVLVAGGGAGGQSTPSPGSYSYAGGGGGAGGVIRHTAPTVILAAGDHTVTIGSGGDNTGTTPGNNSSLSHPTNTYTALGGGGGGTFNPPSNQYLPNNQYQGGNGGSGGGASGQFGPVFPTNPTSDAFAVTPAGSGTAGQGNPGGGAFKPQSNTYPNSTAVPSTAGGGGGAGGAGANCTNPPYSGIPTSPPYPFPAEQNHRSMQSGNGGDGLANPEFPEPILAPQLPSPYSDLAIAMGPTGLLGGGGGGGNGGSKVGQYSPETPTANEPNIPGAGRGGPGGGGDGTSMKNPPMPATVVNPGVPFCTPGVIGSGGGGGGGAWGSPSYPTAKQGGNGGSGILMVRYATPSP